VLIGAVTATVASAGVLARLGVQILSPSASEPTGSAPTPSPATAQPVGHQVPPQPLSQDGRIVAVSADSVTAQSADGRIQTYRVTPDTTSLTPAGNHVANPASAFAVNDEVQIVGEVRNGMAVATTVADRDVSELNGPPMDAIEAPVSGA